MSAIKFTVKSTLYLLVLLLFVVALAVQGMRTGLYYADRYHVHIERFLSERLSADVNFDAINAQWRGLRPRIELTNLTVVSRIDSSVLRASQGLVVLDLSDTFLHLSPVFKTISFADLSLTLSQNAQGAWAAPGFLPSTDSEIGRWQYRSPSDLFSTVKFAELNNTQLTLQFFDGRIIETVFPYTSIHNEDNKHYLNISASIDGDDNVFAIQIEGEGHPSHPDEFTANAFVSLNDFPAERLSRLLLDQSLPVDQLSSATLDASLWFDFNTTREFSMSGNFEFSGSQEVDTNQTDGLIAVKQLSDIYQVPLRANIQADYQFNQPFTLRFENIEADNRLALAPISVVIEKERTQLATDTINVKQLTGWFTERFSASKAQDVVSRLAPRGELQYVHIEGDIKNPTSFVLQAYANDLAINSYLQIPQFEQVTGFIETSLERGTIALNANRFSMASQPFFENTFVTQAVEGNVHWTLSPKDNAINIQGENLQVKADFGQVSGFFNLDLPWTPKTKDSHLMLQLGLQKSDAQFAPLLLPAVLPARLRDWLDTSVKQADINNAGILYRGGFKRNSDRALQVYLDVGEGQIAYQPDWPLLNNVAADVIYDDRQLFVDIKRASTYDDTATGSVIWNAKGQNQLHIQANVETGAQSALGFVENSPLKRQVGDTFSRWDVSGDLDVNIDLLIDLNNAGEFISQEAEITLADNRLFLSDQNLEINQANGQVLYSLEKGFTSSDLNGDLFGEKAFVDFVTQENGDLLLTGGGTIGIQSLSEWLQQPLLSAVSDGKTSYTFDFLIPTQGIDSAQQRLSIYSDLNNIAFNLPVPFGKAANESKDLIVEAVFENDVSNYQIQLDNHLHADLNFTGEDDFTAIIDATDRSVINIERPELPDEQANSADLLVYGQFAALDVEGWLPFFETLDANVSESANESFSVLYDIRATDLQFMGANLKNVSVLGYNTSDVWENTVASDTFAGNVFFRETDAVPLTINLDYLLLSKQEDKEATDTLDGIEDVEKEKIDPLANVDFNSIPSAAVTIKYLEYDDKALGEWSFDIDAQSDAIAVDNIHASIADLSLAGIDPESGARLRWLKTVDGQKETQFYGKLSGGNLKTVFEQWGLPPSIDNQQLHGAISVQWPGSPAAVDVTTIIGDIDFLLEEGVFLQNGGNATGFLRVLNFLNFDTWVKRIQLDFSGLNANGVAFDNVSGSLQFNEGLVRFTEPVEVNGSSLSLVLSGLMNLPAETIDGKLSVVLPVGGNINFAAALAAGLPAAVGVYLVRRIFKDAIEQASTVNYIVSGDLNKPSIVFDAGESNPNEENVLN